MARLFFIYLSMSFVSTITAWTSSEPITASTMSSETNVPSHNKSGVITITSGTNSAKTYSTSTSSTESPMPDAITDFSTSVVTNNISSTSEYSSGITAVTGVQTTASSVSSEVQITNTERTTGSSVSAQESTNSTLLSTTSKNPSTTLQGTSSSSLATTLSSASTSSSESTKSVPTTTVPTIIAHTNIPTAHSSSPSASSTDITTASSIEVSTINSFEGRINDLKTQIAGLDEEKRNLLIAVIVLGAILFILFLLIIVVCVRKRRNRLMTPYEQFEIDVVGGPYMTREPAIKQEAVFRPSCASLGDDQPQDNQRLETFSRAEENKQRLSMLQMIKDGLTTPDRYTSDSVVLSDVAVIENVGESMTQNTDSANPGGNHDSKSTTQNTEPTNPEKNHDSNNTDTLVQKSDDGGPHAVESMDKKTEPKAAIGLLIDIGDDKPSTQLNESSDHTHENFPALPQKMKEIEVTGQNLTENKAQVNAENNGNTKSDELKDNGVQIESNDIVDK